MDDPGAPYWPRLDAFAPADSSVGCWAPSWPQLNLPGRTAASLEVEMAEGKEISLSGSAKWKMEKTLSMLLSKGQLNNLQILLLSLFSQRSELGAPNPAAAAAASQNQKGRDAFSAARKAAGPAGGRSRGRAGDRELLSLANQWQSDEGKEDEGVQSDHSSIIFFVI